jgi:rubrerythrin
MRIEEKNGALVITDFDAADALAIALRLEKDGISLYRAWAEKARGGAKDVLLRLAKEEQAHAAAFADLREELGVHDESDDRLAACANFGVFAAAHPFAQQNATVDEVAVKAFALSSEQNAISLYRAIAAEMSEPAAKAVIARIIAEEEQHVKIIASWR